MRSAPASAGLHSCTLTSSHFSLPDNDDGSAFYHTHHNVFWDSDGFKTDYGGHDSIVESNLVVVRTYDGQACINSGDFVPGHETRIYNQTCVLPLTGSSPREPPDVVIHVYVHRAPPRANARAKRTANTHTRTRTRAYTQKHSCDTQP